MNLFDLMAKITLDTSEYEKGLEDSEKQAKGFGNTLKGGLKTAGKVAGTALAAVGTTAIAAGAAILKGAGDVAEYGDNIDKMSQKIGFSAKGFQEWDFILKHNGSSIEAVQRGMMSLQSAADKGSDAFEKLGISQEELASMNNEELWDATIKGLQGITDESERAKLAEELFGKGAKELGPLLNTTAEETEAMRQQVNELGGVMSDEAVKAAAAYQDSLQNMQTAIGGLKNKIFTEFLPGITGVMDGLTDIFSGDTESGVGKINAGINDMVTKISEALPHVIEVAGQIMNGLMQAITDNLPTIIASGTEILMNLIVGIVEALPSLVEKLPEIIKAIGDGLIEAAPALLNAGVKLIDTIWEGLKSGWDSVSEWFGGLVDKIKGFLNFDFDLPHIPLPHFAIDPAGWRIKDLLKGVIPSLGIEWYAKAYNDPFLFTSPTVVGDRGFGDGGSAELVYGRDNLMRDIKQAASGNTFNATINIAGDIPDPKETAEKLMYEMKAIFDREAAAHGA